jgi:hypothetical protein
MLPVSQSVVPPRPARHVGGELEVAVPEQLHVVAEVEQRAEDARGARLAQHGHADPVVEHLRAARVDRADAAVAPEDLGDLEPRGNEPGDGRRERLPQARAQRLHVRLVDAAAEVARAPDALCVGALVVVRGVDDQVVEAEPRLVRLAHALDEAVREADHVRRHDPDAQRAVVEHHGHRLELVVHAGRRAPVLEAGHPYRVEAAVAVPVLPAVRTREAAVPVDVGPGVGGVGRDRGAAEARA